MDVRQAVKSYLKPVVNSARGRLLKGRGRYCNCCDTEFKRFLPAGHPKRPDASCPRCGSRERHRLLVLMLSQRPGMVHGRTLHFAPEPSITGKIRGGTAEYVTADLEATADVKADITELPFDDDRWDLIICSHVLEHVVDDKSAMRELRRVLAPGGHAVVMVPRNEGSATDEDPSVTDEGERRRRFGQKDHVRIYGDDLESRLRGAGFTSIESITRESFTPEEVERHRLQPITGGTGDAVLICS